jgi:hypothetical protein
MLYLNPPFPIINGVSLFPDHADRLQFYFLPLAPKLTMVKDPVTGGPTPQIQLLKFRGMAGDGAFSTSIATSASMTTSSPKSAPS